MVSFVRGLNTTLNANGRNSGSEFSVTLHKALFRLSVAKHVLSISHNTIQIPGEELTITDTSLQNEPYTSSADEQPSSVSFESQSSDEL